MKRLLLFLLAIPLIVFAQDPIIIRPPELSREFHGIRPVTATSRHRPKIGIVLSGGGARGIAQIGVLRALEKHRIPIDLIVGNSMGSVVGGLYASGYTTAQIESITVHANWDEVLSFTESTRRTDLFVGQKQSEQAGYLVVRFDGLEPIIPSSISGGQRLFNFFTNLTLQALYHPNPSFDDLKIPFRAVATDLLSGKRVIFEQGSLGEALRASVTVPLLYAPLERDSMRLVDGGLVSNMPVDIADSLGCDLVIVVNSTSGMRREDQLGAPWQIADQIMTIMMAESNRRQMEKADLVITPDVGDRIVSDFSGIEELIARGERSAEESILQLQKLIHLKSMSPDPGDTTRFFHPEIIFVGDSIPDDIRGNILGDNQSGSVSYAQIEEQLVRLSTTGMFRDVYVEITNHVTPPKIVYHTTYNSRIAQVYFTGNNVISDQMVFAEVSPLVGKIISYPQLQNSLENVLKLYRDWEYSLARIESVKVDSVTNTLSFVINEGVIQDIRFEGNRRTKDYVLRREIPLTWGDVFKLDEMYQGLINLTSLGLFEYVLLDIRYEQNRPVLVVKVNEKSSELLRFGLHTDNERGVVSTFDIRDANFRGAGEDLALTFRFGLRDRLVRAEYRANRIFRTYLTFNLRTYFTSRDVFTYRDESTGSTALWDRIEDGQYKETKYGGSFTFGSQLERFGNVTAEIRAEHHRIAAITGLGYAPEDYRFVGIKLQTTVDTENKFAFPTEGMMLNLSYESALKGFGSEVSFSKIGFTYENYWTFLLRNTVRSRISVGFADKTLPTVEQYSFGGLNSFFGVREDDSRGRQIFLINLEYRYWLPFKLIFESFLKTRYDLGTISTVPEDLKFNRFRHGIGLEIGLDTPLGPAAIGAGKSFYFRQDLPGSPVSLGPLLFYFSIGPSL